MALGAISPNGELPASIKPEVPDTPRVISESLKTFAGTKSLDRPNEARPSGLDRTLSEVKVYQDSIDYQRRKSSRDLLLSKKQREELKEIVARKKKAAVEDTTPPPKVVTPVKDNI